MSYKTDMQKDQLKLMIQVSILKVRAEGCKH